MTTHSTADIAASSQPKDCDFWEVGCNMGNWVADGVVAAFEYVADEVVTAVADITATLGTFWVGFSTPSVAAEPGSATPSAPVGFVQDSLWWYVGAIAILSVIVAGARMAITMRAQPLRELMHSLLMLVLVSGAGVAVVSLLVEATDQFSAWIIDRSTTAGFGASITGMLAIGTLTGVGLIVIITLGTIAAVASIIQIVLLIVRGGLIVVLAGILPLTVAAYGTEQGRQWFRKAASWLLAFILYKPAAAIVYATAFALVDISNVSADDPLIQLVMGMTLMIAALFALPALMRFVTPMVASVTGSGSGGGGAALGAAAAAMPTGSKKLGKATASGVAASTGESGPSGSGGGGNDEKRRPQRPDRGPNKPGSGKPGGPTSPGGPTPAGGSSGSSPSGGAAAGGGAGAGAAAGGGAGGGAAGGGAAGGAAGAVGAVAAATVKTGQKAGELAGESTGPGGAKDDHSSAPPAPASGSTPGPSGAGRTNKETKGPDVKQPPQSGGGPRGSKP